ncbi:MAG TPA: ABC transporter permease [Polyangia bacterium]|jgi:lipoprotein-releasing system permease protein|nr:ABC transporter permease [Polyangia bacterium]
MSRWVARGLLLALAAWAVAGAVFRPAHTTAFLAVAVAALLVLGLSELFALGLERFVGLRYLHRTRSTRAAQIGLIISLALAAVGWATFFAARGHTRALETAAVIAVLVAGLGAVTAMLLRLFSVFTTVSTMGVVLGVASLIVVMAVTSGFEREFQDKVLALNAHLIVIPYGTVDIDSPEADRIQEKLRGIPGVVRMAKFLFSAGEVMVGRVGANLKGIDLRQGADDLRRSLVEGSIEALEAPARCPTPAGGTKAPSETVGRIILGTELAHRLRLKVGDCVPIMVPFSNQEGMAPPSFRFKVVGLFRMGFNEYDTRLAYVSLQDARMIASARGSVFGVELRFADPRQALTIGKEIKQRLDAPYRVIDWKELNHNLFMALTMQKVIISLLLVLIIIVAAFNIIASLTMIVLSKVREIAILKSMGAPSAMVARVFLVGGVTVGSIGTGFGILYGLLVCLVARLYGYPLDPKVYLIGELPVQIAGSEIALVAAATLLICFLATLYPSWRASRMRAVDGLRYT